jgi:hypothetical protein
MPSAIATFFTGQNTPPRPAEPAVAPVVQGSGPEIPGAPIFLGPTPEERALMRMQLEAIREQLATQRQVKAALGRLYGRPFEDVFAEHVKAYNDLQLRQLDQQAAAVGEQEAFRRGYATLVGQTPGEVAARLAQLEVQAIGTIQEDLGRQREIAGTYLDRFRKAARGEVADPAVARMIQEERQRLDERMRAQYGPGWESSTPGSQRLRDFETGVREGVYRLNRAEMDTAAQPALYGAAPLLQQLYTAAPLTREAMGTRADLFAATSPAQAGSVLAATSGPSQAGNDLLSILQRGRQMENAFALDLFGRQSDLALQDWRTRYLAGTDLLKQYYNDLAAARQQQYKAGADLTNSLIAAGGSIGAAFI